MQGIARHNEIDLLTGANELYSNKVTELPGAGGIVDFSDGPRGTGIGIYYGADRHNLAIRALRAALNADLLTFLREGKVVWSDGNFHPHAGKIRNREDLLVGADRLTKDKVSAGHTPRDRRADLVEAVIVVIDDARKPFNLSFSKPHGVQALMGDIQFDFRALVGVASV